MESQSISLGDLFSVELFVGSITFVLGTVLFFLLLLLNLRLNLKTTLLYCCLQLILVVSLWGIERSGFFNGREKWAKDFENQRV